MVLKVTLSVAYDITMDSEYAYEWYSHPAIQGYYANALGQVCSTNQILRGGLNHANYLTYNFRGKTYNGHRFVWECFNGPLPPDHHVDHLDQNRVNNALWNLQAMHKTDHMRKCNSQRVTPSGVNTKKKVVATKYDDQGDVMEELLFDGIKEAATFAKRKSPTTIRNNIDAGRELAGYIWAFVEPDVDLPDEEWKTIHRPEGLITVSNLGRVQNCWGKKWYGQQGPRNKIIKLKNRVYFVHRLVCEAFHGEQPKDKPEVDHIDRDFLNNRADNLRWVDRFENMANRDPYVRRTQSAPW